MNGLLWSNYIQNFCRKSALKAVKSAVDVAGGNHEH